jgi:colanic acid/amylovoran biosynthesis glycosyltransferase
MGIKDVVIDGVTGLLVQEGDIDSMAAYIVTLARQPVLAEQLGQAARKHIENNLSLEISIMRLRELLSHDDAI